MSRANVRGAVLPNDGLRIVCRSPTHVARLCLGGPPAHATRPDALTGTLPYSNYITVAPISTVKCNASRRLVLIRRQVTFLPRPSAPLSSFPRRTSGGGGQHPPVPVGMLMIGTVS